MTTAQDQSREALGQAIDRLDALAHSLALPLPASIHVTCLRGQIPEVVGELKAAFVQVTGENPWE